MLTKQDLTNISNLLFTGKWGMSLSESNQTIAPLINKIAQEIDSQEKKVEKVEKKKS